MKNLKDSTYYLIQKTERSDIQLGLFYMGYDNEKDIFIVDDKIEITNRNLFSIKLATNEDIFNNLKNRFIKAFNALFLTNPIKLVYEKKNAVAILITGQDSTPIRMKVETLKREVESLEQDVRSQKALLEIEKGNYTSIDSKSGKIKKYRTHIQVYPRKKEHKTERLPLEFSFKKKK